MDLRLPLENLAMVLPRLLINFRLWPTPRVEREEVVLYECSRRGVRRVRTAGRMRSKLKRVRALHA